MFEWYTMRAAEEGKLVKATNIDLSEHLDNICLKLKKEVFVVKRIISLEIIPKQVFQYFTIISNTEVQDLQILTVKTLFANIECYCIWSNGRASRRYDLQS